MSAPSPPSPPMAPYPSYPQAPFATDGMGAAIGAIAGIDLFFTVLGIFYFCRPLSKPRASARPKDPAYSPVELPAPAARNVRFAPPP